MSLENQLSKAWFHLLSVKGVPNFYIAVVGFCFDVWIHALPLFWLHRCSKKNAFCKHWLKNSESLIKNISKPSSGLQWPYFVAPSHCNAKINQKYSYYNAATHLNPECYSLPTCVINTHLKTGIHFEIMLQNLCVCAHAHTHAPPHPHTPPQKESTYT